MADRIGILVDGVLRVDCPTDHFKESIRKVVLEFAGSPPEFPVVSGPGGAAGVAGRRLELVFVGYGGRHREAAESLHPLSIDVVELNLEDAFIEYTRARGA